MICVALGLALARAPASALPISGLMLAGCALAAAHLMPPLAERPAMIGCASGILITALAVHLERIPMLPALLLSANAGLWTGAIAAGAAQPSPLIALPLVLVLFPARWVVARGHTVVLKVVSGWLVAVAILTAALPLITTPGYEPDHME